MQFFKKKRNFICLIVILACIICLAILSIYPMVYQKQCKTRNYDDLENKLTGEICSANVRIVTKEIKQYDEASSSTRYGETGCGVIFAHEDGYYFVITAAHVVDSTTDEKCSYYIVPYDTPTYQESYKKTQNDDGGWLPTEEYYSQFEEAKVEYISNASDVAIIKFKSDVEFECLDFAEEDVIYGDKIICFCSSAESASDISYGKITSKEYKIFDTNDGRTPDKVLFHNAYVTNGASGGAVLDENLKIAGITIGGQTGYLGRFRHGVMIPVSIIDDVLQTWKLYK